MGMNWDRAASRDRVRSRGADPISPYRSRGRPKRRSLGQKTKWIWITAKFDGNCVTRPEHEIKKGNRCRYNFGTRVTQCAACASEFGEEDPDAGDC